MPPKPPVKLLDRTAPRKVAPVDPQSKFRPIERSPLAQEAILPPAKLPVTDVPTDSKEALIQMLARGIKPRPFDDTDEVIAPTPIGNTPQQYDAKGIWDYWVLVPTCDTLISFKG